MVLKNGIRRRYAQRPVVYFEKFFRKSSGRMNIGVKRMRNMQNPATLCQRTVY